MSDKNKVEAAISAIGYKNKSGSGAGGVCDSESVVTIYDQNNQVLAEANAALIFRSVNLREAYEEIIGLFIQSNVPSLLRNASDNHESQFYGEDIVSRPLANKIELSLKNLATLKSKLGYL